MPGGRDLVENVSARHNQLLPMRDARLIDDQIERIGAGPILQNIVLSGALFRCLDDSIELIRTRINESEGLVQIEGQRTGLVNWPFEQNLAAVGQVQIQKTRGAGE